MIAAQFSQLEIKAQAKPWTQLLPWEPNIGASALSRALHIETFAACLILTKIAKPDLRIDPTLNDLLFRNPSGTWVKIATEAAKQLGLLT